MAETSLLSLIVRASLEGMRADRAEHLSRRMTELVAERRRLVKRRNAEQDSHDRAIRHARDEYLHLREETDSLLLRPANWSDARWWLLHRFPSYLLRLLSGSSERPRQPMAAAAHLAELDRLEQEAVQHRAETLAIIDQMELGGGYTPDEADRERRKAYLLWNRVFEDFRAAREAYWQCE